MVKTGEMQAQKSRLRQQIKERRKQISSSERERISDGILQQIRGLELYRQAETIFCYVGTEQEIDTVGILQDLWRQGKRVGVPKCIGNGQMAVYEISSMSDLKPGSYGILEPDETLPVILPESMDLALVPCLSCSSKGVRIGYGGGYYDRYLPSVSGKKLALCAKDMMCEEILAEEYDCKMDGIITEKFVIFC